jgi:RimJ/RimL family protein N-acetyltransferase
MRLLLAEKARRPDSVLIRQRDRAPFDFHGLAVRDFGVVADGSVSVATVDVPAHAEHRFAYSSACHKLYLLLEGCLRFDVDGVAYEAESGDLVAITKGTTFRYFDHRGIPARLLLVHSPPFDSGAEHIIPNLLREHDVHLTGERVRLRPMKESDWKPVLAWNADSEVLMWADCTDEVRPPEETKAIYRGVSLFAHVFIIELDGVPIGECWLQKMNMPDIIAQFPDRDLRRIDLAIGRKELWGQGLGSDTIRTLVRFGLEQEKADGIFGLVDRKNARSWGAFRKSGFHELQLGGGEQVLVTWRETRGEGSG